MDQWLPLTDYATKYKVSVSTLRRRIKAEDIKYLFQEGKYFINDKPISMVSKLSPSLGYSTSGDIEMDINSNADNSATSLTINQAMEPTTQNTDSVGFAIEPSAFSVYSEDQSFLANLRKTANTKLPQLKNEVGMLNKNKSPRIAPAINIEDEYYFKNQKAEKKITAEFEYVHTDSETALNDNQGIKDFSEKISKIGNNEPILTAANKLLAELKKAYTQILQEKEEQIMSLKEEVSDLRTLVKVLESENNRLKNYNSL